MGLPFLPGNSFDRNFEKNSFHRSQKFFYKNNVQTNVYNCNDDGGCGTSGRTARYGALSPTPPSLGWPSVPAWLAYDKAVLCFDATFGEEVTERRDEIHRTHRCKVFYFLEDGTMKITEPKEQNSGMEQGVLVRRHRIPRPDGDSVYAVDDLNVGCQLTVYGVEYTLTDCDQFTRRFLTKAGVEVGTPVPVSNFERASRQQQQQQQQQRRRHPPNSGSGQSSGREEPKFWKYDGQVLRFSCLWRDEESQESRRMTLKYYLADDTMEINEAHEPNSGRSGRTFLRRCRLPKGRGRYLEWPGDSNGRPLLNVFQDRNRTTRCLVDAAQVNDTSDYYYQERDLAVGSEMDVLGRRFELCDCDQSTRDFYRRRHGIDFPPVLEAPAEAANRSPAHPSIPPYNGFGSHEDSLASSLGLLPKPPRKDFAKFLAYDRRGLDGNVLRFSARLLDVGRADEEEVEEEEKKEDDEARTRRKKGRSFVLSFYLVDDTVQIYEVAEKNSGLLGGRFLERRKVMKPGQEGELRRLPEYYSAVDLGIGRVLEVNRRRFRLTGADEYTMNFMEKHREDYPESDVNLILEKISSHVTTEMLERCEWSSSQSEDEFRRFLDGLTNRRLTRHEIHSLSRHLKKLSEPRETTPCRTLAQVRDQLKRNGFQDFQSLTERCYHFDAAKTKLLPIERVALIFKSMRLPVEERLLDGFLREISSGETGNVDYEKMIELLNWKAKPVLLEVSRSENSDDDEDKNGRLDATILRDFLSMRLS